MLRRSPRRLVLRTAALIIGALVTLACTPAELVPPSAQATPGATLAVVDMLPRSLRGAALVDQPDGDLTTGALARLVRRLGKTTADMEATGRSAPTGRPSVMGVRIAGVDGARLLAEMTALLREILGREVEAEVPADVISVGDRRVTRLVPPRPYKPLYLLVSQDTIFLIAFADEHEADEFIRQIP